MGDQVATAPDRNPVAAETAQPTSARDLTSAQVLTLTARYRETDLDPLARLLADNGVGLNRWEHCTAAQRHHARVVAAVLIEAGVVYSPAKSAAWTRNDRADHEAGHPSGFDCFGEAIVPPHEVCGQVFPPEPGEEA